MESLLSTSSVSVSASYPYPNASPHVSASLSFPFVNSFSSSLLKLQSRSSSRSSVIVASKKLKKLKKEDKNSDYLIRPDESNGFFPEAVLLKKTKVQEDGRVLPDFADADEEKFFEYLNLKMESDLNVDQMRHYEVVYMIHEKYVDQVGDVNEKLQDFISEKKGKIWRQSDWGLRKLAYKIKKASKAHYMLMNIELDAQWINEFKSMLDKDERVIRHLTIKRDKAIIEECPPPPEFQTVRTDMMDDADDEFYDDEEDEEWDDEDEDEDEGEDEEGEDEEDEEEGEDDEEEDEGEEEGEDEEGEEEEDEEWDGEDEGEDEDEEEMDGDDDEEEEWDGEDEGEDEDEEEMDGDDDEDGVVVLVNGDR